MDTKAKTKHIFTAEEVTGPVLRLWKVSRMDMGAYMCIAKVSSPFLFRPNMCFVHQQGGYESRSPLP